MINSKLCGPQETIQGSWRNRTTQSSRHIMQALCPACHRRKTENDNHIKINNGEAPHAEQEAQSACASRGMANC